MRRIWIEPGDLPSEQNHFIISGEAFHHAVKVSRFRIGEEFEVVHGGEDALKVRLVEINKKTAQVEILGHRKLPKISNPQVNLAIGITKWSTFEEIIEKAVELGVHTVQPLLTDFSFVRTKKDWPVSRQERFQKIVKAATEQSGRGPLMTIAEPTSLPEFTQTLNQNTKAVGLFAYEGQAERGPKFEFKRLQARQADQVWAVIGPEGGFSIAEVDFMQKSGYPPITLGPQILRADTACFAIISIIKYAYDLMEANDGSNRRF